MSTVWPRLAGWLGLFSLASFVHSAEIAITTLWPWKVREFADEEGVGSPFAQITDSLTPVMTAMLVTSTACSVCGTTLATSALGSVFGSHPRSLACAGAGLAAVTIFFGELLPKTLGVYSAEPIARAALPHLTRLAYVIAPVGKAFSFAVKTMITPFGWKYEDEAATASVVSEAEVRLLVSAAGQSGSIGTRESTMVESVLDLQDTKVSEIMTPRVEVVGIDKDAPISEAFEVLSTTKYSRLPVYASDVDNVTAVVLSKSLIRTPYFAETPNVVVEDLSLEPTYFVPESMSVWSALEAMKRRRCHLAIVVDEYGGTAGIVTLEDILEEIVGEIYDEQDGSEAFDDLSLIQIAQDNPRVYRIRGDAELDDVRNAIFSKTRLIREDDAHSDSSESNAEGDRTERKSENGNNDGSSDESSSSSTNGNGKQRPLDGELYDCVTLSGLLCAVRGEIPEVGDLIYDSGLVFEVEDADDRRILQVLVWRGDDPSTTRSSSDTDVPGEEDQGTHSLIN